LLIVKIEDEYFSIESEVIDSIEDYNKVIFNEDMSECLTGNLTDWNEGLDVVKMSKNNNINAIGDNEKKLARLIILNEKKKKIRIALIVNSILGVVTNSEEGKRLISQLYLVKKARLSRFDITNVFIT
jgi:hypothetical protein